MSKFVFFYKLDGNHKPVPATPMEFENNFRDFEKYMRVGLTTVGELEVSTVFLGYDVSLGLSEELPILFETMIRKGNTYFDFQWRYHTWEEAVKGHAAVVELVEKGLLPDVKLDPGN